MFETKIKVGVVAVVKNDENEILMMLRNIEPARGQWAIPGGKLEMFEKAEDCIVREIKEELNLDVKIEKFVCNIEDINKEKNLHWIMPFYITKIVSGKLKNNEPDKHKKIEWFSLDKAKEMNISFMTKEALTHL